jgi:hypothetical protein
VIGGFSQNGGMRALLALAGIALALLLVPLGAPAEPDDGGAPVSTDAGDEPPMRVYVVAVDGLRPGEVAEEPVGSLTPTLSRLRSDGTWYEQARAVLPAETLPNHAAMMSGVLPERSGIIANNFDQGNVPREYMQYPSLWQADTVTTRLERAFDQRGGIATATVLSKEYLYGLFRGEFPGPGDPLAQRQADFHWDPRTQPRYIPYPSSHAQDSATMDAFRGWIAEQADLPLPQFAFVNLGDVDRSGHADESGVSAATGGGVSAFRQAALEATDAQLGLLVDDLKQSGSWDRTVLIITSDHGMDWGPQNQYAQTLEALTPAGYRAGNDAQSSDYTAVGGGGSELFYVYHQSDLAPMARILCGADGVAFVATREPVGGSPAGCEGTTLAAAGIDHPRSPDIEVFMEPGWHSSPGGTGVNPLPGNHGHSITQHQTLLVAGGHSLLDDPDSVPGATVFDPAVRPFAPPADGPGNLSIAPTVSALFGIGSPAGGYDGAPLAEAFEPGAVELHGNDSPPASPPAVGRDAPEAPASGGPDGAPLLSVGVDAIDASVSGATYQLYVANRGDATAEGVVVTSSVPQNTTLTGSNRAPLDPSTCPPGAGAGTQCRWALGELAPGAFATVEVTYGLGQTDTTYTVSNTASAQLAEAEPASGDPIDTDGSLIRASDLLDEDASVDEARAETNFGVCDQLQISGDNALTAFLDSSRANKWGDRDDQGGSAFLNGGTERLWGAELRATVASIPSAFPGTSLAVHRVVSRTWDEGSGPCAGGPGSGRQAGGSEPVSAASPIASAPIAAPGPVSWDVTSALDSRERRFGFTGFELRTGAGPLGATDMIAFHSSEAGVAANRPRLVTVRTKRERTGCVDTDPENPTGRSDRRQRIYAYVTDSSLPRVSDSGGRDACNGTPVPGAPVGWELDSDSPDSYISSLAGETVLREHGSQADAGPNRASTLTGPNGSSFIDTRLARPYAEGDNVGQSKVAAIAIRDRNGYQEPPFGSSDQGVCEPGEPNVVWGTSVCAGTGESAVEDDVEMSWEPVIPPVLTIDDVVVAEGNSGTSAATFTVSLSAPSELLVEVDSQTADETATAPGDYTAQGPSTLVLGPGEAEGTVTVPVNGDEIPEGPETFSLDLSNAENAAIAKARGIATILDDDPLPGAGTGEPPSGSSQSGGEPTRKGGARKKKGCKRLKSKRKRRACVRKKKSAG